MALFLAINALPDPMMDPGFELFGMWMVGYVAGWLVVCLPYNVCLVVRKNRIFTANLNPSQASLWNTVLWFVWPVSHGCSPSLFTLQI